VRVQKEIARSAHNAVFKFPSAALSSAAEPGDFGARLSEHWQRQCEFSEPPGTASSARERVAPREQGAFFFGYFREPPRESERAVAPGFGWGCKAQSAAILLVLRAFATPQTARSRDATAARGSRGGSVDKQKKVTRPSGRDPTCPSLFSRKCAFILRPATTRRMTAQDERFFVYPLTPTLSRKRERENYNTPHLTRRKGVFVCLPRISSIMSPFPKSRFPPHG
jgi:hypothetical protein